MGPSEKMAQDSNNPDEEMRMISKIFFSVIASLALIENTAVLLLFVRNTTWLKRPHNQCILSLAIADVMTAISLLVLPKFVTEQNAFTVPSDHLAREVYCRVIWSHFIPFSLGITSVYTCLVLAIERWFAVVRPYDYKQTAGVRIMKIMIPLCWLAGFVFEGFVIPRVSGVEGTNTTAPHCKWSDPTDKITSWSLAITMFVAHTIVPVCVIPIAYLHLFFTLRRQRTPAVNFSRSNVSVSDKIYKRATIMMAVASLTLILCWLPNNIYFLLAMLGFLAPQAASISVILSGLAFLNSCVNPIIYGYMNKDFRKGYRQLLFCCSNRN